MAVKMSIRTLFCSFVAARSASAFSSITPAVTKAAVRQRNEWQPGVEIELPNFELLFDRIQMASPLAKLVMDGNSQGGGFRAIDDSRHYPQLRWKKIERNEQKTVHRIDKLDSFQNVKTPLLRFRSTIKGPCIGERFSHFIMDLEERKKWDDQIAFQEELYPIEDLALVDRITGDVDKFGRCMRVGVGYVQTKQGIISPREQLILGGHQEFKDGSTILWGTEMEEYHNHLLPPGQRHTRAKSHLFAATLAPTGPNSFDVEYLLQMDVGGGIPNFMTTPAITDVVKKLFNHAKDYFEGEDIAVFLKNKEDDSRLKSDLEFMNRVQSDFSVSAVDDTQDAHPHHSALKDSESLLFTP
ncbi:hypothetical protein ACHAWX_003596 [Stephanocyclus meneghinianus]